MKKIISNVLQTIAKLRVVQAIVKVMNTEVSLTYKQIKFSLGCVFTVGGAFMFWCLFFR